MAMCTGTIQPAMLQSQTVRRSAPHQLSLRLPGRPQPGAARQLLSRPAALGGSDSDKGKGAGIAREEEPEEFWQTAAEAKGESPFKTHLPVTLHTHLQAPSFAQDPLAIIGIVSILFPFLILGIAIASGYLDLSPYQYPHH